MYHEELREWMRSHKMTQKQMAKEVGRSGLGLYFASGKPLPIDWLLRWQKTYHWTDAQLWLFAFRKPYTGPGEKPKDDGKKVVIMDMGELLRLFQEA